jgi:hypothetical protein
MSRLSDLAEALGGLAGMNGRLPNGVRIANPLTTVMEAARAVLNGQHGQWCEVHRSVSDNDGCHWDRLMGPRPGRGKCQLVDVRIIDWKERSHE